MNKIKILSCTMTCMMALAMMPIGPHMQVHAATENDLKLGALRGEYCTTDNDPSTTSLDITLPPEEEKEICFKITNSSAEDIPVQVNFVDGAFTSNSNLLSCRKDTDIENFGKYVTGVDSIVTVPANGEKEIRAKIKFGADKIGKIFGCVSYRPAVTDNKSYGGMSVIVRKSNTITAFVAGNIDADLQYYLPEDADYIAKNDKVVVINDNNGGVKMAIGFNNVGDLAEQVKVKGTFKDTFGKTVELAETEKTIIPGQKDMIGYSIPKLAWYKMRFTADFEVTHQPIIEGIDPQYLSDEIKNPKTDNVSITFFIFPWWIVIVLGVLVLLKLIFNIIRRRMKVATAKKNADMEEFKHRQEEHDHTK